MEYRKFTDLDVYKKCRSFRKSVSTVVRNKFPKEERYLLSSQILDASWSVTANIAEGYGRYYYQDNIKFCRYSRGSLEETLEHLITAYDDHYISKTELETLSKDHQDCLRLLNGYIKYLRNSKLGKSDGG